MYLLKSVKERKKKVLPLFIYLIEYVILLCGFYNINFFLTIYEAFTGNILTRICHHILKTVSAYKRELYYIGYENLKRLLAIYR